LPRGRKDGHVLADLGDDHLGGAALDTGNRAQQLKRRRRTGRYATAIAFVLEAWMAWHRTNSQLTTDSSR